MSYISAIWRPTESLVLLGCGILTLGFESSWYQPNELVPGHITPITYKIEICHFLARFSALFG